jgi:hypothetical protein
VTHDIGLNRSAGTVRLLTFCAIALGIFCACTQPVPSRKALDGTRWFGKVPGPNGTASDWLVKFSDTTATIGQTKVDYAIKADTILLLSRDQGIAMKFLATRDSLSSVEVGFVLRRVQ